MANRLAVFIYLLSILSGQTSWAASSAHGSTPIDLNKTIREIPFSFLYDGKPSSEFIGKWKRTEGAETPAGSELRRETLTYTDPQGELELTCEISSFPDSHAVEWLLRLKNIGKQDTAMIQDLRPLDLRIPLSREEPVVFHSAFASALKRPGDQTNYVPDYTPVDQGLVPGSEVRLSHYIFQGATNTQSYMPFFNAQWGNGGLIGAIGWTGQWMLYLHRSEHEVVLQSGQETTHFILHPGEEVRTPRILLLEWKGKDRFVGQNEFRQLLIAHYLPRIDGQVPMDPIAHTGAYALIFDDIAKKTGENPLNVLPNLQRNDLGTRFASPHAALNYPTETNQLALIRGLPDVGIEAYWLDAGWFRGGWPNGRGNWVPNDNFPDGLKPLGDAAHARGIKFLLWFEPEGVSPDSIIAREHPEWVLHQPAGGQGVFRFADPRALAWMTDLLSKCIKDWGVDILRIDRNTTPLPFWQAADAPDRQGITEMRQIEGFYALWDGLQKRFPKLEIDNANWRVTGPDLEVMKRSLGSLTRTEIAGPGIPYPVEEQAVTAELSLWVPLHATLLHAADAYDFRSAGTTGVAIGLDLQSPYVPIAEVRKGIAEIKELRPYWLGDFFPLTEINRDETAWAGWQLHRVDLEAGFAMMFRRSKCTESGKEVSLHDIDPRASYEVTLAEDFDPGPKHILGGEQLQHLHMSILSPRGSLLVRYKKVTAGPR